MSPAHDRAAEPAEPSEAAEPTEDAASAESPEAAREAAREALGEVMREIDEEVARRRASGDLPVRVERELDELFLRYAPESDGTAGGTSALLGSVEAVAFVDPVVPVGSEKSGGAAMKRTVRSLSLWYVGFVTDQVNQFTGAVVRYLHDVDRRLADLTRRVDAVTPPRAPVVEAAWARGRDAWWVATALDELRSAGQGASAGSGASRGPVLHVAAGDGWLLAELQGEGATEPAQRRAYGVDPRLDVVERAEEAGLDVRQEDIVEHLEALGAGSLSGMVLSGVTEPMTNGARLQLLELVLPALAPGGTLVVHSLSPSTWTGVDAPAGADRSPGRPWRAESWVQELEGRGLAVRTRSGPVRPPAGVSAEDPVVSALLGPADFLVVATRPPA